MCVCESYTGVQFVVYLKKKKKGIVYYITLITHTNVMIGRQILYWLMFYYFSECEVLYLTIMLSHAGQRTFRWDLPQLSACPLCPLPFLAASPRRSLGGSAACIWCCMWLDQGHKACIWRQSVKHLDSPACSPTTTIVLLVGGLLLHRLVFIYLFWITSYPIVYHLIVIVIAIAIVIGCLAFQYIDNCPPQVAPPPIALHIIFIYLQSTVSSRFKSSKNYTKTSPTYPPRTRIYREEQKKKKNFKWPQMYDYDWLPTRSLAFIYFSSHIVSSQYTPCFFWIIINNS